MCQGFAESMVQWFQEAFVPEVTVPSDRYVSGGQLILAKLLSEPGETASLVVLGLSALGWKSKRKLFRRV